MSRTELLQIGVLGLGNLMRTDDAAGMLALRRLTENGRLPRGIEAIEGGTLGLDLLHALHGISHLLVLDAVDTGADPGTLVRFQGQELANLPTSKSVHLLGLADLMDALRLMEASPTEVVLLGVQPESTDWGTVLTPEVEAAQSGLIEAALKQVAQWDEDRSALMAIRSLVVP
ncbi:hydrogenase maturation protease [Silvibacterium bohemicum]|jgi:hydrogenase maturation protease|uniref:Hydrogenase maturation protease n=1 Tax=Silvibacterium bohemicum TaxID=1577686 RepID=A0A841JTM9_9BACT|nr:HyaD/HybD family hydrogenase maturation endopeptidase [Silvibacterium bohemicum]MBB6143837.1 hydrogenase maturation protease [Silvibacterium bohemicum]